MIRRRLVSWLVIGILPLTGCGGDEVISKKQFNQVRRDNIELVNDAAPHVTTRKGQSREEIGACTDLGPEDQLSSTVTYSGPVRDDALDYINNTLGPRLEADGWTYRDRENHNDSFDRIWSKNDNGFGIRIESTKNANPPYAVLTTVSPCAEAPGIDAGPPDAQDPWYIPLDS